MEGRAYVEHHGTPGAAYFRQLDRARDGRRVPRDNYLAGRIEIGQGHHFALRGVPADLFGHGRLQP